MSDQFRIRHFPGLFYRADNLRVVAGHMSILSGRHLKGWMIYRYNEQAPGWALHRRWDFKLFCLHHVGSGKATDPQGWSVTWAGFYRTKCCHALAWRWADNFGTGRTNP